MTYRTPGLDAIIAIALGSDENADDAVLDAEYTRVAGMILGVLRVIRSCYDISLDTGNFAFDTFIEDVRTMVATIEASLGNDATTG